MLKDPPRLKDIEGIVISTEKHDDNIFLFLDISLRKGKTRNIGGLRLWAEKEDHPKRPLFSFKLPTSKEWTSLKLDELTFNVGFVKAKFKSSSSS